MMIAKIEAARLAGIKKVIIPNENMQETFEDMDIKIVPVENIFEVFNNVFSNQLDKFENAKIQKGQMYVPSPQNGIALKEN